MKALIDVVVLIRFLAQLDDTFDGTSQVQVTAIHWMPHHKSEFIPILPKVAAGLSINCLYGSQSELIHEVPFASFWIRLWFFKQTLLVIIWLILSPETGMAEHSR